MTVKDLFHSLAETESTADDPFKTEFAELVKNAKIN